MCPQPSDLCSRPSWRVHVQRVREGLWVAASGGNIGGFAWGKTDYFNPGVKTRELKVELSESRCSCCITKLQMSFGQTMYLPKRGDTLQKFGGLIGTTPVSFSVSAADVVDIGYHEAVHAISNRDWAEALFPKTESECLNACWSRPATTPWTERECRAHAEMKVGEAISHFYAKAQEAGIKWHDVIGLSYGSAAAVDPDDVLEYFEWFSDKVTDWTKTKFCN